LYFDPNPNKFCLLTSRELDDKFHLFFLQRGRAAAAATAATLPPAGSTNGRKRADDEMSEMSVAIMHDDNAQESLERQKEREEEARKFSEQASVKRY
jgi:hypothetical protein